jgi:hypothetical protein
MRLEVTDAMEARVVRVEMETAPEGASATFIRATVTEAGSGSHSEDM